MVNHNSLNTAFAPPMAPIKPYTGTFGKKQLRHLLRRSLFGASNSDMKAFEGKTLTQVVDALLNITDFNPLPPLNDYYTSPGAYAKDPVYEKNADGTIKKDANGNPIQAVDANGNLLFTNKIDPVTKLPIVEKPAVGLADNGVKFGETWVNTPIDAANNKDGDRRLSFKSWWSAMMIERRDLREKMTLFWSNHFGIEADVVSTAILVYRNNQVTRKHSLGNFKDMVRDMTIDGGMLRYLNGFLNRKGAPDENYARELQELFTVGKGSGSGYTEDDVKAAAKVLTGWQVGARDTLYPITNNPAMHDTTDKKFSAYYNNTIIKGDATANGAMNELNALLNMIFAQAEVSKFIVRKLYTFFVYYEITPDVEINVIEPLAELFRTGNYQIKPVMKALLTSEYFFKDEYIGSMVKSPLDNAIGLLRQFEIAIPPFGGKTFEARRAISVEVYSSARNAGQDLQDPPDVAGWPAYYQYPQYHEIWINTASYPIRQAMQRKYALLNGLLTTRDNTITVNPESARMVFKIDYPKWLKTFSYPQDPNLLIDELADLLFGVPVSQTVKTKLKTAKLFTPLINSDAKWSEQVTKYLADSATTDALAKLVPLRIQTLIDYMVRAAEIQLH